MSVLKIPDLGGRLLSLHERSQQALYFLYQESLSLQIEPVHLFKGSHLIKLGLPKIISFFY